MMKVQCEEKIFATKIIMQIFQMKKKDVMQKHSNLKEKSIFSKWFESLKKKTEAEA